MEFLKSVNNVYIIDKAVANIVQEESAYYFAGQKTPEEVAAVIQNRVSLYLAETG
jgi:hypothetical protein